MSDLKDHKQLGQELELFFTTEIAPGAPFWLPRGMVIFKELEKYIRELTDAAGYLETSTPIMVKSKLFKESGHWDKFGEHNMYNLDLTEEEDKETVMYSLKPMNCPESTILYRFRPRSYRELPLRLSEIGRLHRREKSEKELANAINKKGLKAGDKMGDGAFYGPKIDVHIKDSQGREWQLATVQLDFHQPEAFKLEYIDEKGEKQRPVMIHRAIFGSFERFIAILTEHFQGAFPTWLSPVQVMIIPISEKHLEYAQNVLEQLKGSNLRVEVDSRSESMQSKIRDAQMQKVPYMLVVGDREASENTVAVRQRSEQKQEVLKIEEFISQINKTIESKSQL